MRYKEYIIEHDRDHVIVTSPDGDSWTEDTITEAKQAINKLEEVNA